MGKWIFRIIAMAVIGGAVIFTAQFRDGGRPEKGMSVQKEKGLGAAKAEKSDGTEENKATSGEVGMGTEKASSSGGVDGERSLKEAVRKDLTDMYFEAFCDLIQSDPGLGEDAACYGFDFSKAGSLTQEEKESLADRLKKKFKKSKIIFGTWEELKKAGYIEEGDGGVYWEDGMLLTLEVKKEKKNHIVFSISAWRSGLGAVGKDDCKAKRGTDGKWEVDDGTCWIS